MLLFDEITANLDAETEKAVLLALKRVAKDRTVISISHRTSAELGRIIYNQTDKIVPMIPEISTIGFFF